MEIMVARYAGFCFGVERAIDIVKDAAKEYSSVVTFGPIIHNPQVVGELKDAGVATVKSLDEVSKDMCGNKKPWYRKERSRISYRKCW